MQSESEGVKARGKGKVMNNDVFGSDSDGLDGEDGGGDGEYDDDDGSSNGGDDDDDGDGKDDGVDKE